MSIENWIPVLVTALVHIFVVAPVIYWSLNAKLERDMDSKIKEQRTENQASFAPKSEVEVLSKDMKRALDLFERIDGKLDRFLAMKPPTS